MFSDIRRRIIDWPSEDQITLLSEQLLWVGSNPSLSYHQNDWIGPRTTPQRCFTEPVSASWRKAEVRSGLFGAAPMTQTGQERPFLEVLAMHLATQVRSAHARYT